MKTKENELLVIQTSDSSSIFITKDLFPHDDPETTQISYSICEGYNPLYWSDNWHSDLQVVINLMEFSKRKVSCKRDYIGWWLNCRPSFVDDSIKPMLKKRLQAYHLTGEIRNAFSNINYGLEYNSDCLLEWHSILDIDCNEKLIELTPIEDDSWYNERNIITIYFEGFLSLPYSRISIKTDIFPTFQKLLDFIYGLIRSEVSQFSYNEEWVLFNTNNGIILNKNNLNITRNLTELKIKQADNIICYKK
jgi:hypothetical protein